MSEANDGREAGPAPVLAERWRSRVERISFEMCAALVAGMVLVHAWAEVLNVRAGNPFDNMPIRRWRSSLVVTEESFRRYHAIEPPGRPLTEQERRLLDERIASCQAMEAMNHWAGVATFFLLLVPVVIVWSLGMIIFGPLWRRLASPLLIALAVAYAVVHVWRFTLD